MLEGYCVAHPGNRYAFRPHPNRPETLPEDISFGCLFDGGYSIEAVIWASDVLLLETSTVGLQAALVGKSVITIAAENYPPYAELDLAVDVPNLASIEAALNDTNPPDLSRLGPAGLGDAGESVIELINQLLGMRQSHVGVQ